ncbi:MAG: ATP-binding protein [Micromonospora sp.]
MGRVAEWRRVAGVHPAAVDAVLSGVLFLVSLLRKAPGRVRSACRTALDELATRLGVRRRDKEPAGPTEPAPSLNRLDALVEGFAAGQPVRWTFAGQPRPLPGAVDVAAYRIIEESLTNARRHAPGAAVAVRLRYDPEGLTIEVRDDGPPTGTPGSGSGLRGMRKRAEGVGGSFSAGPRAEGGFLVRAVLPAPEDETG